MDEHYSSSRMYEDGLVCFLRGGVRPCALHGYSIGRGRIGHAGARVLFESGALHVFVARILRDFQAECI